MSDVDLSQNIYSKISFAGDSIEIITPKSTPDAQHVHTVAYVAALNELRHREADRVREINDYAADQLDTPVKIHSRENPAGLIRGSKYRGTDRIWRPALPLVRWEAPKPPSDKQSRANAIKLQAKTESGKYLPKAQYPDSGQNVAFKNVLFEESE